MLLEKIVHILYYVVLSCSKKNTENHLHSTLDDVNYTETKIISLETLNLEIVSWRI